MKRIQTFINSVAVRGKLLALATVFAATGLATITSSGTALAVSGDEQWCAGGGTLCLNAWNGGPAVNVYSPGYQNNHFNYIGASNPNYVNLIYAGPGGNNGKCIGDYGNASNNARVGMVNGCGTSSIGWGGNFLPTQCSSNGHLGYEFWDVHWNGYLGPQTSTNGSAFYLNKPTPWCFEDKFLAP